ncbi:hypothetical protein CBR_g12950 [Chara braunii]|uniref:Integrase zinc-binding domain-containing protein n=1 Tax=Chara braunii TaxID=69332 RepID=A0A388KTH3_CHABU|nr:hypothetical protein CBR_g12950 [Chara braunii]|eukprot:GBG73233.1 hypothetical protein CBR_g12950 [Chara braunii]
MVRKVPGLAEESQCAIFLSNFTECESVSLTRRGAIGRKLTWETVKQSLEDGELDQVYQFRMIQQRQKRTTRVVTEGAGINLQQLIADGIAKYQPDQQKAVGKQVLTVIQPQARAAKKGKVVEQVENDDDDDEEEEPTKLTKRYSPYGPWSFYNQVVPPVGGPTAHSAGGYPNAPAQGVNLQGGANSSSRHPRLRSTSPVKRRVRGEDKANRVTGKPVRAEAVEVADKVPTMVDETVKGTDAEATGTGKVEMTARGLIGGMRKMSGLGRKRKDGLKQSSKRRYKHVTEKSHPVPVLIALEEEFYYEQKRELVRQMKEDAEHGPCRINERTEGNLIIGESGFLTPQEKGLMVEVMKERHCAYAFDDDEHRRLDVDKVPMIRIHIVPHVPWNLRGPRYPNPAEERRSDERANEDIPPVDAFLDEEEDVKLHINAHVVGVSGVLVQGQSAFLAPAGYVKRADIVLKNFEEEDPWGGKDVEWMAKLALAETFRVEEDPLAIESGAYSVDTHARYAANVSFLVNSIVQVHEDGEESRDPVRDMEEDEFEEGEIIKVFRAVKYKSVYRDLGLLLSCKIREREATKKVTEMLPRFLVRNGHLFIKNEVGNPRTVICGRNRQIDVIATLHDGPAGGHKAFALTYAKARELYYWEGMSEMIRKYCESCVPCQIRALTMYKETLHPRIVRDAGAVVHLDLLAMPQGVGDYNYIFDARDNLTRFEDQPRSEPVMEDGERDEMRPLLLDELPLPADSRLDERPTELEGSLTAQLYDMESPRAQMRQKVSRPSAMDIETEQVEAEILGLDREDPTEGIQTQRVGSSPMDFGGTPRRDSDRSEASMSVHVEGQTTGGLKVLYDDLTMQRAYIGSSLGAAREATEQVRDYTRRVAIRSFELSRDRQTEQDALREMAEVARGEVLQDAVQRISTLEQVNKGLRDMVRDLVASVEQARQSTSILEQRITDLEEGQKRQATIGLVHERRTEVQQAPIGQANVPHEVERGGMRLDTPRRDSRTEEPLRAMGMTCEEAAVVDKLMLEPDEIKRWREAKACGWTGSLP